MPNIAEVEASEYNRDRLWIFSFCETRKARSLSIYEELAKAVSLKKYSDPLFAKLTGKLMEWFGG